MTPKPIKIVKLRHEKVGYHITNCLSIYLGFVNVNTPYGSCICTLDYLANLENGHCNTFPGWGRGGGPTVAHFHGGGLYI